MYASFIVMRIMTYITLSWLYICEYETSYINMKQTDPYIVLYY